MLLCRLQIILSFTCLFVYLLYKMIGLRQTFVIHLSERSLPLLPSIIKNDWTFIIV